MSISRTHVAATLAAATTAAIGLGAQAANASTTPDHARPDINRSNCLLGNPLTVVQSSGGQYICFENAGKENVKIYNIDSVYTGNNGTEFTLSYDKEPHVCRESVKDTYISAEECGVPYNEGTMVFLSIYPGRP